MTDRLAFARMIAGGGAASEMPARGCAEARRVQLLDAFSAYQVEVELQPGDFVVSKPGLCILRTPEEEARHPLILWRFLEPAEPLDALLQERAIERGVAQRPNCLLAHIDDAGHSISFLVADVAQLARLPEAECEVVVRLLQARPIGADTVLADVA